MQITETDLDGVLIITPRIFEDGRGWFSEIYHAERYASFGVPVSFVQDNLSWSERLVLRGLHFQYPHSQAKLIYVLKGEVFDVAVDIRAGSPSFGRWVGTHLNSKDHNQLFVPEGFAHGFVVLSEMALFGYKCSEVYHPETEKSILWNDPDIGIDWPVSEPLLSPKDAHALTLAQFNAADLPSYRSEG